MRAKFLLLLIFAVPCMARAGQDSVQMFPPENISECHEGSLLRWDGPGHSVKCEDPLPTNTILAFDLAQCPAGWEPFVAAEGRTLIGISNGQCNLGEQGGENSVTLTLEQMPKHSHNIRLTGGADDHDFASLWTFDIHHAGFAEFDQTGGGAGEGGSRPLQNDQISGHTLIAANGDGLGPFLSNDWAGGSQPFDNRQAFVGVLYCKKSADPAPVPERQPVNRKAVGQ